MPKPGPAPIIPSPGLFREMKPRSKIMPRGKLFALAFAGFLLGAVAVPAGAAEVGANPAPDYAAMMRAHMERQRALTELFT
ncbi:hypothetical protein ABTP95_19895, partial [Acinetobacter baumannii]